MPITSSVPCRHPVTRYTPQVLQPSFPTRAARLAAQTKLPGVCMSIIGMLKLPTLLSKYVVYICGKYCIEARTVAKIPRKFAHPCRFCGRAKTKQRDRIMMTRACRMHRPVTTSAVRNVGALWSLIPSVVVGEARGKKMRNSKRLEPESVRRNQDFRVVVHYRKATPLHTNLQDAQQPSETSKAINIMAACNISPAGG